VLGELLGRGGMAEVFAGHAMGSHGFQKPVAIKRLLPELANDHVFVERLISEAKLLVGMQHGNVVSVLDLARDGDDVFLVMEYMDGPSLRQLLKARGDRLSISIATYIVQSAAAGLEFAHIRPGGAVIHADISPSNILLTTSGEVRVADFGIARREGVGAGVVEGKWAYMAPEQARGEPLTPRSDVFSLGVVLYELICGQHPLGRQVTAEERDSEPLRVIPPRVVKPTIPPGIDAICMRALANDARDRYASMQQMIDALVEERFANQWREGANDLAQLIRSMSPGAQVNNSPRTLHTDRPVTIVTRSLISSQPLIRASSPRLATEPPVSSVDTLQPVGKLPDSAAQTRAIVVDDHLLALRADGTPAQLVQQLAAAMLPSPELASVHGGTFTGSAVNLDSGRANHTWTFGVLGIAAILGVVAAVAIQLAPSREVGEPVAVAAPIVMPIETPKAPVAAPLVEQPAPVPAPVETKAVVTETTPKPEEAKPETKPAETKPAETKTPAATIESKLAARRRAQQSPKAPVAAIAKKTVEVGEGILRVDERNAVWAGVTVNGEYQETPNAKYRLPPGTYTVQVRAEAGSYKCQVVVEASKTTSLKLTTEDLLCK